MKNSDRILRVKLFEDDSATFLVRWRGKQSGPLTGEEIEEKLAANRIGLLHEILVEGEWTTLRKVLADRKAAIRAQIQAKEARERQVREQQERQAREAKERLERELTALAAVYQRQRPLRTAIPSEVRREVWRRDEGQCAKCGSRENLEYDHIVPVSKGGSNTARNVELLCESCNRSKSDSIE